MEEAELIKVIDNEAVVTCRRCGDAVQLAGVRQPNADGVNVDAVTVGSLCLGDCPPAVDVGYTIWGQGRV